MQYYYSSEVIENLTLSTRNQHTHTHTDTHTHKHRAIVSQPKNDSDIIIQVPEWKSLELEVPGSFGQKAPHFALTNSSPDFSQPQQN